MSDAPIIRTIHVETDEAPATVAVKLLREIRTLSQALGVAASDVAACQGTTNEGWSAVADLTEVRDRLREDVERLSKG